MKPPVFFGDWPIPTVIRLPGLRVRVIPDPSMDIDGLWTYDFEKQRAVIRLNSRNSVEVQRYVLLHEILHAVHEEIDVMLEKFPNLVRTKWMDAALTAVLPSENKEEQP